MTDERIHAAEQQQEHLRQAVLMHDELATPIRTLAGVDVAYEKDSNRLVAAVAVLDAASLAPLQIASYHGEATFPYVPGLFSFRELPAIIQALEKLTIKPDLIICDGQGRAHPRRFGLACHLGVVTGIPTIGCAKTRLIGTYAPVAESRGSHSDLIEDGQIVGQVVRTQTNKNPVYVSIGHKITLATATKWVLYASPHYRLPETTRAADQAVKQLLRSA
ncbi:MAG TPA: deoxyribonuclease V [Hymenobacter sp.]